MGKYSRASRIAVAGVCFVASTAAGLAAPVCAVPIPAGAGEQIERIYPQDQNRWLVETKHSLFHLNEAGALEPFEGAAVRAISHVVAFGRDQSLIFAHGRGAALGGVFRADKAGLKIHELNGSEALRFTQAGRLAFGGAIVGTDRGLYRVDGTGAQFQEAAPEVGRVTVIEQIDDSAWLVGGTAGLFRADGRASRADRVAGGETGEVAQIQRLADNGWLVSGERGLFRADPGGRNLTALAWRKTIRAAELHKLHDGSWIARADQGLFLIDANGRRLEALDEDAQAWRVFVSDERGVLLQNKRLLYVLPPGAKKPEFVSGEPVNEVYQARGVQDGWLIGTRRGLFRVDFQRKRLTSFRGPAIGRVVALHPLKNGTLLVAAEKGVFRTDQSLQGLEPVPGAGVGQVLAVRTLSNGGFLLGTANGLFRVDADGQAAAELSRQADVATLEQLTNGSWLASGRGGVLSVDASGTAAAPVAGISADERNLVVQPIAGGRALLGSSRGILSTATTLADADVTLKAGGWLGGLWGQSTTVAATLRHPCAGAADTMNLAVEARPAGEPAATAPVRVPARLVGRSAETATVSADLGTMPEGRWNVRLVADANTAVGSPATILIERSYGHWLQTNWPWILLGLAAVQAIAFGAVLGLSRWRPGLLRFLRSGWGASLIWLSFLVPRSWRLQQRALACWFRTQRRALAAAPPAIDVAVRGPESADLEVKALLERLGSARRIWLQGPSGFGKTTSFIAWQSAFFAQFTSLAKAAKRFGFVLLPVPDRVMSEERTETDGDRIIFDLADAALHDGWPHRDPALVGAMVRHGRLALAFDAPDATIRNAIHAFTRKHPKARVIVTSEHSAPRDFEDWRLPAELSTEMVERLLQVWLGAYSGSRLTTQLEREDILSRLVTVYDVRLVADLVVDDPKQVIPTDRISLYRALFARAQAKGVTSQDLETLRTLAWTMTIAGRSRIKAEELAGLDRNARDALLAQGTRILRESAGGYAFDHDQLRFLLAAENLVGSNPSMFSLVRALESSAVWDCDRGDQEGLWRFVAAALRSEELPELWRFSLEDPARALLQCALRKRGYETKIFPLGMASVLTREESRPPVMLRAVEA